MNILWRKIDSDNYRLGHSLAIKKCWGSGLWGVIQDGKYVPGEHKDAAAAMRAAELLAGGKP
jgi:hypothetical protein